MPIMFLLGLSSVLPKISSNVPQLSITLMLLATQLSVVTHAKFTCDSDICIAKPELSITTDVNGRCFSNAYSSVCRCMVSYDWSQSLWSGITKTKQKVQTMKKTWDQKVQTRKNNETNFYKNFYKTKPSLLWDLCIIYEYTGELPSDLVLDHLYIDKVYPDIWVWCLVQAFWRYWSSLLAICPL